MKEVNINHIDMDLDGDGIPEKYILKDKALNALFLTLANIAFSSDYNDLINQPDSLPASDVYEWAKNIAKPEYTKNEIGLENVDNTSDLNKPVSIAQQKAIDDAYANSNGYTDQKISELINGAPTSLDTLGELAKAMTDNEDVVAALEQSIGSKANKNEFDSHVGNDTIHITSSERTKWNKAISGTDDTKDNVVSFTNNDTTNPTSWSDVSVLTSGEKHTSIFTKISTMFKNIRYLYKLIGTTDISAIGNGTITGGLSTLNSNFTVSEDAVMLALFDSTGSIEFTDSLKNYKVIFLVAVYNGYVCATNCQFTKNFLATQYWIACMNDGTVRKIQLLIDTTTNKKAEVEYFENVTRGYVFGIK